MQPNLGNRRLSICGWKKSGSDKSKLMPWDLIDRMVGPIICCHAAAILLSGALNLLRISQVSALVLFILFTILTVSGVLFYHSLTISPLGKAVLITGCESPLARALAKYLDDLGFTVFGAFKKLQDNDDATALKESSSGRLKLLQLNVTSEVEMLEASLYVAQHLPAGESGLWALVHCDLWNALGELEWVPFPVLRKSFDVNVLGASRLTQIMLPLIRSGKGRIVFLSSALAHLPSPVRGVLCATQAAIEGLAVCLRKELANRQVGVSIVCASELTAGDAWLNDEDMREQAKTMWSLLSDEQKNTYGEDYFEQAIRSLEPFCYGDGDFQATVRSLSDAIVRTFPVFRYTPLTFKEKFQIIAAEYMPTLLYEIFYKA
ncbi:D-beta-hydroxybutyrate dehydrogenase, mitochondrial [Anopheles merus]|uniref:D-beta-hydroxybutyrate dehydrogenase, mitochondrial n=1 Tax=Anopheles merus TaxID=30066 RepID=UPI001BE4C6CE|nr:D-beta-hydroxybutyrate dehydrogenase, mitochondrial [Anopheles merus]XP_041783080.1 D-beta-hydroxybutyrate dehydrogenase, mitochondrial [Anopheles merus]XP_041783081.1 D-beta-hydroxybutyrate dehydrogenase, mitochondrial [Anopheles merus]XP_041783082.1 D-beta-hydroxybutyrate dehydrogenase, mitochondrial [Anopheles merus]XP_041783083.1 D-beta-hydroxybutyrate dehydrogenase, mitochondrial [Anopheles merus]XP_041783084.1 D-beta-hydroxybutyrate dehydrogenase, mitochondrial [Anopheles merus]XP_04